MLATSAPRRDAPAGWPPAERQNLPRIRRGCGSPRQPLQHLRQQYVAAHQVNWLNHDTFVIEPGRDRHRPGRSRADIRMMRAVDHERTKLAS